MPELKGRVAPTAELHHQEWRNRPRNFGIVPLDIIDGMAKKAEQEKYAAGKRDYRESTTIFCQWLADTESKPEVQHLIAKPPVRREEEIATEANITDCPNEIVDMKAGALSKIWSCSEPPREQRAAILQNLRMQAPSMGCNTWT
eukprot:8711257-Pyramimonas_sp.AAC.1